MLSLRGRATANSNRAIFEYYNPVPFRVGQRIKLLDISARPTSEEEIIRLEARIESDGVKENFALRKPLSTSLTVRSVGKRFKQRCSDLEKRLTLFQAVPCILYDEVVQVFTIVLPPRWGIICETPLFLLMLGFGGEQLTELPQSAGEKTFGIFNEHETDELSVTAAEECPGSIEFSDLFDSLGTTENFPEKDYEEFFDENFTYTAFFLPDDELKIVTQRLSYVEKAEDIVTELSAPLRRLEKELNLETETFVLQARGMGLSLYVSCAKPFDLEIKLQLSRSAQKLLGARDEYKFSLRPVAGSAPLEGGKRGLSLLGPIGKITKNSLESMLPLVIRLTDAPSTSYISGVGPSNILAFIDSAGDIVSEGTPMHEYDNRLELLFLTRSLEDLIFEEAYSLFAIFLIE